MSESLWKTREDDSSSKSTAGPAPGPVGGGAQVCKGPSKQDAKGLSFEEGEKLFAIPGGAKPEGSRPRTPAGDGGAGYTTADGRTMGPAPGEGELEGECVPPGVEQMMALDAARTRAGKALGSLNAKAVRAINQAGDAQSAAWRQVMTHAASNPEMALGKGEYLSFLERLGGRSGGDGGGAFLGKVAAASADAGVGKVVEGGLKLAGKGVSKLATVARVLAGGVGGFIVGIAGSLIFEAILDLFSEDDARKEADAIALGSKMSGAAEERVRAATGVAVEQWLERYQSVETEIGACNCAFQLDEIITAMELAEREIPPGLNGDKLGFTLLEMWTLQNASDPGEGSDATNSVLWERAAKTLDKENKGQRTERGGSWVKRKEGEIQKPDLYRDQLALYMARAGLELGPLVAVVEAANPLVRNQSNSDRRLQKPVAHRFDRAKDPARWAEYTKGRDTECPSGLHKWEFDAPIRQFVEVTVNMRLNGEGVAWVDGLDFVFANQAGQTWATWTESV